MKLSLRIAATTIAAIVAAAVYLASPTAARAQATPARAAAVADLIVTGGRIYTVDEARPTVQAFAVRDGRIIFTGSAREAMTLRGPATRVLDVTGKAVYPGFVDAHAHLLELGQTLGQVALAGASTYDEVIARVVARAKTVPAGSWIVGRGWDQNLWPGRQFPSAEALSRAVPNNPVLLARVDGHALLVNARAMAAAGVTAATKDPTGGRIIRLASGEPSGVFVDNAQDLVGRALPQPSAQQLRDAVLAGVREANRWGLVGIHDMGNSRRTIEVYESLAREGRFNLRDYVMIRDDSADLAYYFARGPRSALYDGRIWVGAVKLYADGALGSRGAALLAPYSDDPGNSGLLVTTPEHLRDVSTRALRAGFQVATHAIGDRGNRNALDAYAAALAAVPRADHRFRVDHAQVLSPTDIPRFAELGVIPSMQASHQTSDMKWAEDRLGAERVKGAYAWRSLLNTGVVIPNGSDFPVEQVNPLISFHAAVTRQNADNWPAGGWYPEQRMTRDEALRSLTIWPAYAAFQDTLMGSIARGKYADFTVLDRDIMTVAPEQILGAKVVATYLGGKNVYEAGRVTAPQR